MRARKTMSDGESGGLVAIRPLSRLTSAAVSRNSQSYGFDPFGNLTTYGTNTLTIDPAGPNRLNKNAHDYTYENAGNMLGWGWLAFGWDGFDQLQTVQGSGIARYNAYSPEGERVLMRDGNVTTITLRGLDNKVLRDITYDPTAAAGQQWRWSKDYVYRDGSLLASVSATDGIRHYALDHLGSPRLLTDRCGERKKLFTYLPFGQEVPLPSTSNPEDKERMRFTVHERDLGLLDTGADDLDYMHARTYGPSVGRFLSTDPVTGKAERPQSWNLFSYVASNPVGHSDPTGELDPGEAMAVQVRASMFGGWLSQVLQPLENLPRAFEFTLGVGAGPKLDIGAVNVGIGCCVDMRVNLAGENRERAYLSLAFSPNASGMQTAVGAEAWVDSRGGMGTGRTLSPLLASRDSFPLGDVSSSLGQKLLWTNDPTRVIQPQDFRLGATLPVAVIGQVGFSLNLTQLVKSVPKCPETACGDGTSLAHFNFQIQSGAVTSQ